MTTKPDSLEERARELTVEETLRWLRKLEKLESDGAKLIHVKHLLARALRDERRKALRDAADIADQEHEQAKNLSAYVIERSMWPIVAEWLRAEAEKP